MPIDPEFLNLLRCPLCLAPLREEGDTLICTRTACNLRYSVTEGIPVLLLDEARRPCPKCGGERKWSEETLTCPKCGETFRSDAREPLRK